MRTIDTTTDVNIPLEAEILPVLSDKKKSIGLLAEDGFTTKEIANTFDITPQRVSQVKKELSKYFIQDRKFLAKGKKIIKKIQDDFLSDKGNIKDSTALRLVEMQQDRINPVVKAAQVQVNNFTVINLDNVK